MSEIGPALAGINATGNIIKALLGMAKDAAVREKVIELQTLILDLQADLLEAQSRALSLQDENASLKERIRKYEADIEEKKEWDRTASQYRLVRLGPGSQAYLHQAPGGNDVPSHYLCPTCFESRKKSILQRSGEVRLGALVYKCPVCEAEVLNDSWG